MFLTVLLLAAASAFSGEITAERIRKTPLIDGKLNEDCWQNAKPYRTFLKSGEKAEAANANTSVKVLYDDDAIYFGIRCEEPDIKDIQKESRPRDGGIYQLDCLEIMLDPALTKERYYHFMVSANNDVFDAFREQGGGIQNKKWNGIWNSKVFIGNDFWSCEIRIPFFNFAEDAPIDGAWGINICRGKRTNPREDSSIAGNGAYHNMGAFLKLTGINADLKKFRISVNPPNPIVKVGDKKRLFVENSSTIVNCGQTDSVLLVDSWLIAPDGNVYTSAQSKFVLRHGESRIVTLPPISIKDQGEYLNALRVTDQDGRVLAYRDTSTQIRFSPISIRLLTPWYRHSIFETQKIKDIEFDIHTAMPPDLIEGKTMEVSIGNKDKVVWTANVSPVKNALHIKIDNTVIPYGRYVISAVLKNPNGTNIDFCTAETRLWKLPFKQGETWLGNDNTIYIEGKPFFFHSVWGGKECNMPEHTLIMEMNANSVPHGQKWFCTDIIFKTMGNRIPALLKALQGGNLEDEHREIFRKLVHRSRDEKNLVCYYLVDEPSSSSLHPEGLRQAYEVIKEEDPYHPVVISDSSRNDYIEACDINAHHPYPNVVDSLRINDCTPIAEHYDKGMKKLENGYHRVSFVFMDMGFNKYDFGLGPKEGRIATFAEFRGHTLMALASGMKGLMPFNSNYEIYPEAVIGFPVIVREGAWLGQAVVSPDSQARPETDNTNIRLISKDKNGEMVIIASNVSMTAGRVTFKGLPVSIKSLNVMSEERTVPVVNGEFTDAFEACEGHAYTSGPMPKLQSVRETQAQIEKSWAERKKNGNILFQRFKDQNTKATASSFKNEYGMCSQDSTLWHLFDGYVPTGSAGYGLLFWSSVPGQFPAWLEVTPRQPAVIGRIELYPLDKSVRNFDIQFFNAGKWETGYEEKDVSSNHITCRFSPRKAEKIRINVSAANGNMVRIGEIEAYEK
jgi:hypothetical protein